MNKDLNRLSPIIWDKILKSKRVLLNLHHSPDGDSVGSNLAFLWLMKALKKKCTLISGDSSIPTNFSKLPGFKSIEKKNIFDVKLNKYDLYIVLDSSSTDQITKIKPLSLNGEVETIVIDHHASNIGFGDINLIDSSAPATCQIIFDLFKKWKVVLSYEISAALLIGLYSDTGGFKFSGASSRTLRIASDLAKNCPDYHGYIFEMENNNSAGKFKFLGLAYDSIKTYFNDNVVITAVSHDDIVQLNIDNSDISSSDISSSLKSVVGWNIGISMVEKERNKVILSMRTRDPKKFDLTKIVKGIDRKYGEGGGHPVAAGAAIYLPIKKAKEYILEVIQEVYPELKGSR